MGWEMSSLDVKKKTGSIFDLESWSHLNQLFFVFFLLVIKNLQSDFLSKHSSTINIGSWFE